MADAGPQRIVSLLPSATETVHLLGLGDRLVGRSHECDVPAGVLDLPVCSSPKYPTDGTSYEIEERIRAIVQEGLGVYRVDAEVLAALEPEVILTQDQCEVCAVGADDVADAVCTFIGARPKIYSVAPRTLSDIWEDIVSIAGVLGVPEIGRARVLELRSRVEALTERAAGLPSRPTVLSIEWLEPLMTGGNWMPDLIARAGGRSVRGVPGEHSPWMRWEDVGESDPETILFLPCGFSIARTRKEIDRITCREGWDALQAVRSGNVFLMDGHHFFNRPGPRIVESLEILAEILHPEVFDFGHRGIGWEPL